MGGEDVRGLVAAGGLVLGGGAVRVVADDLGGVEGRGEALGHVPLPERLGRVRQEVPELGRGARVEVEGDGAEL